MSGRNLVICLVASLLHTAAAFAQRSPFNGLEVLPADSTGHYRIIIGGHFHGESSNRSGYPASTLLANIDTINSLGANLFLSTGDLFMDAEKDRANYDRALFSKLKVPFFNAPGNHDGYESDWLGPDFIRVYCGPGVIAGMDSSTNVIFEGDPFFVYQWVTLFDTEESQGSLDSRTLEPLRMALSESEFAPNLNIFIISHRPIWAEDDPQYSDLFKDNTRSLTGTNFQKDVYPVIQEIAKHAHVYWISGSLGGGAPSSIFFQEHATNITYIQCAIRDEPRDALLIADVYPDSVHWSALSLTGQVLQAPQTYNAEWWRKHTGRGEGFNWRMLPYKAKVIVTHRAFWWGAACALLLVFIVRRFLRR